MDRIVRLLNMVLEHIVANVALYIIILTGVLIFILIIYLLVRIKLESVPSISKDPVKEEVKIKASKEEIIIKPPVKEEIIIEAKPNEIVEVLDAMKESSEGAKPNTFEEEQEDNAVISYTELIKLADKEKPNIEAEKKTQTSKVVSPVLGKEKNKNEANDDFLEELKKFRRHL